MKKKTSRARAPQSQIWRLPIAMILFALFALYAFAMGEDGTRKESPPYVKYLYFLGSSILLASGWKVAEMVSGMKAERARRFSQAFLSMASHGTCMLIATGFTTYFWNVGNPGAALLALVMMLIWEYCCFRSLLDAVNVLLER